MLILSGEGCLLRVHSLVHLIEFAPTQSSRRLTDLPAPINSKVVDPFLSLGRGTLARCEGAGPSGTAGRELPAKNFPRTTDAPEVWFFKASQ